MANYDVESQRHKHPWYRKMILILIFGTLRSYDPLGRGFFASRRKTASVASLPRPCLIIIEVHCAAKNNLHQTQESRNSPRQTTDSNKCVSCFVPPASRVPRLCCGRGSLCPDQGKQDEINSYTCVSMYATAIQM